MNTLATKDYIILFIHFIIVVRMLDLLEKEKNSDGYKRFFSGRGLINMAGLLVLRQKMRLEKFQNFTL
jgi:hypothetical protein